MTANVRKAKLRLEDELAETSRRSHLLRATVDSCPIAVTIADMTTQDAPVLYANPMYSTLTGYKVDEVIGNDCHYFKGNIIGQDTAALLRARIAAGQQAELEIVKHRKGGTAFLSRLILAPILDENGGVMACIGLQSDITLEAQRRDATEQQREKMAALGRAMGGVAHEINNMLQPVALLVQDAIDNDLMTPKGATHLRIALDCTRNAHNIIGDVLAFSRPASRSGETHQFLEVFRKSLALATEGLARTFTLGVRIECPPRRVEISHTKFSQILVNLVRNAASAMGGAGQSTIEPISRRSARRWRAWGG